MKIAAIIPSYRVKNKILGVLSSIGPEVHRIYVVDDACPEASGLLVQKECRDPRVQVLFNPQNLGVGGAVITGLKRALADGCQIGVKLDGDGQMDPRLIPALVAPLLEGRADYAKGNRFYVPSGLQQMPRVRVFGNAGVSFFAKLMSGYWNIMDPSNGFVAIDLSLLPFLGLEKLDQRYFFESDMLYRLSLIRAVVQDMPMIARYEDEQSNLSVSNTLMTFPGKFIKRFIKRLFYRYFLRDFNFASVLIVVGAVLFLFGTCFGAWKWFESYKTGIASTSGTVMLAGLPFVLGFTMLLFAFMYDTASLPTQPISHSLRRQLDLGILNFRS